MVVADHRGDRRVADARRHRGAVTGVAADGRELLLRQPARLVEEVPWRVQLADVVQRGGGADLGDVVGAEAHRPCDPLRMPGDALRVTVGVAVARLEQCAEPGQRLDAHPLGVGAEQRLGSREAPLRAAPAQPPPQHQVGEHDVARARGALPQRRAEARGEHRQQHPERDREQEQRCLAPRHDRPHGERRRDHDRGGRDQGQRQPALRGPSRAKCDAVRRHRELHRDAGRDAGADGAAGGRMLLAANRLRPSA